MVQQIPAAPGNLDYSLALHCSPTIAGIKAANLIAIKKSRYGSFWTSFGRRANALRSRGISFFKLAECPQRVLLLVYQKKLLDAQLSLPENCKFLEEYGYLKEMTLVEMLSRLSLRIRESDAYPHEIGVFLGYPLEDVKGFIRHKGGRFRLCGYWKVYGDPDKAKQTFCAYDSVRRFYCAQVLDGEKIHTIQYGGTTYV